MNDSRRQQPRAHFQYRYTGTPGDCADLQMVEAALGTSDPDADSKGDGIVDARDLALVGKNFAP